MSRRARRAHQKTRKSSPRVRDGKVQRKNRSTLTQGAPLIRKERPGADYRHVLKLTEVERFIDLIPDWAKLARGLGSIVLAFGEDDLHGWYGQWYGQTAIALCAWPKDPLLESSEDFWNEHAETFHKLGVRGNCAEEGRVAYAMDDDQVRAFQLLHIFLHELGHHHDLLNCRSQRECSRGEDYAENFALRMEAELFPRYCNAFGFRPCSSYRGRVFKPRG